MRKFQIIGLFLVVIMLAACKSPTGEVIYSNDTIDNDTEPVEGEIIEVVETPVENETEEEEPVVEEEPEEEELPYPFRTEGEMFDIYLDDDFDYDKWMTLFEDDMHVIHVNDETHYLKVNDVLENSQIRFEYDGMKTDFLERDDDIKIMRGYRIEVGDGLYNPPWAVQRSMAEIRYVRDSYEYYPEYLVEEDVESYEYLFSEKEDYDEYAAHYRLEKKVGTTWFTDEIDVTVLVDYDFRQHYDDEDMLDYSYDIERPIYMRKDSDDEVVEVAWLSKDVPGINEDITVVMNQEIESFIDRYMAKFPNSLDEQYFCTEEHLLEEGETQDYVINGDNFTIQAYAIEEEVVLDINGEKTWFSEGQKEDISDDVNLRVRKIDVSVMRDDEVTFCFIYDQD